MTESHTTSSRPVPWYYVRNGSQHGPVRVQVLRRLLRDRLDRDTLVWSPDLDAWTPAGEVPELAPTPRFELLPPRTVRGGVPALHRSGRRGVVARIGDALRGAGARIGALARAGVRGVGAVAVGAATGVGRGAARAVRGAALLVAAVGDATARASAGLDRAHTALLLGLHRRAVAMGRRARRVPSWIPVAVAFGAGAVLVGTWLWPATADGGDLAAPEATAVERLPPPAREVVRRHVALLRDSVAALELPSGGEEPGHPRPGIGWQMETGFAGLRRLDDREVVLFLDLLGRALAAAEDPVCAAVSGWEATPAEYWAALGRLRAGELAALLRLLRRAVQAELREEPLRRRPTPEATTAAVGALLNQLPASTRDSLARTFQAEAPSPQAACWGDRVLYGTFTRLPEPVRSAVARAFVTRR